MAKSQVRRLTLVALVGVLMLLTAASCPRSAASSDKTPPTMVIAKWERTAQGTQGAQTTVHPGGRFSLPRGWLSPSGADIRVIADDTEGVKRLEVTGSAPKNAGPGTICTASGADRLYYANLTADIGTGVESANPGQVMPSITIRLNKAIANAPCRHHYGPGYLFYTGLWTITAKADNCCGGQSTATFEILVTKS